MHKFDCEEGNFMQNYVDGAGRALQDQYPDHLEATTGCYLLVCRIILIRYRKKLTNQEGGSVIFDIRSIQLWIHLQVVMLLAYQEIQQAAAHPKRDQAVLTYYLLPPIPHC
jgi:hypothetical protein